MTIFSAILYAIWTMISLAIVLWLIIKFAPSVLEFAIDIICGLCAIAIGAIFMVAAIMIVLGSVIFHTIREGWSKLT